MTQKNEAFLETNSFQHQMESQNYNWYPDQFVIKCSISTFLRVVMQVANEIIILLIYKIFCPFISFTHSRNCSATNGAQWTSEEYRFSRHFLTKWRHCSTLPDGTRELRYLFTTFLKINRRKLSDLSVFPLGGDSRSHAWNTASKLYNYYFGSCADKYGVNSIWSCNILIVYFISIVQFCSYRMEIKKQMGSFWAIDL